MVRWINSNTAVINGGNRFKFVGIIRGQGHPPITYFGNSVEEITEGLNLAEWVYYIKEVR